MIKSIYFFNSGSADGTEHMKDILGGKGANLAGMCNLGINVPPGFTITTAECIKYYESNSISSVLLSDVRQNIEKLERIMNRKFGDKDQYPLLVSVRSGAKDSMPGMMDTILNLGLNDETLISLGKATNNIRFAADSYRRLMQMYGSVVYNIDHYEFESCLHEIKLDKGVISDTELSSDDLLEIIESYKNVYRNKLGFDFPQDPYEQLECAIEAVFKSWMNQRAIKYRRLYNIPDNAGTAVNIQSMVFGNLNNNSGTGVTFTRDPATGEKKIYGEYLLNAQGEDVVAGIRTPIPMLASDSSEESLELKMPSIFAELVKTMQKLEQYYKDVQDIEFTIENDKLWILQTRNAKRTGHAAVKIAYDLVQEKVISKEEAICRIDPSSLDVILHPTLDPSYKRTTIAKGLPASPGSASGCVALTSEHAEAIAHQGKKVILVRNETSPEDIGGMHASCGILTSCGGMTSHAAVVARGLGKPCIVGCNEININKDAQEVKIGDKIIKENDFITIDGSTGEIIEGKIPTVDVKVSNEFKLMLEWVDAIRTVKVRANAETEEDCETAIRFGADGVGLARTEHMFFEDERIALFRQMILAKDEIKRNTAISKLCSEQKIDFIKIFKLMHDLPVNVRLLDPPLHEFLPQTAEDIEQFSKKSGIKKSEIEATIAQLHEFNPMLGHRGARLGITFPEIYEMQAKAIFEAYVEVQGKDIKPKLEIMMPLIFDKKELEKLINIVKKVKLDVELKSGKNIECQFGTMIELPRACIIAKELAEISEYFSFGTNDLTQTTLGISRDDSSKFIQEYINQNIIENDPFTTLDRGVKELISIASERGREQRKDIKLGICGEHGGDPRSISFCADLNFNYVSCSPYRIPIAKFALAAHVIKKKA